MIALFLSPIARYVAMGVLLVALIGGVYVKIRSDAIEAEHSRLTSDALKRTQDAIRSGDNAAITPDRLLEDDGHRRD